MITSGSGSFPGWYKALGLMGDFFFSLARSTAWEIFENNYYFHNCLESGLDLSMITCKATPPSSLMAFAAISTGVSTVGRNWTVGNLPRNDWPTRHPRILQKKKENEDKVSTFTFICTRDSATNDIFIIVIVISRTCIARPACACEGTRFHRRPAPGA